MPIDTSIYSQQGGGFAEGLQQGASMADLVRKNKKAKQDLEKEEAKKAAFNAGVTVNPDGTVSSDANKTMAELAKGGFGQEALEYKKQNEAEQLAKKKTQLESAMNELNVTGQLLGSVSDQASWDAAIGKAKELGISGIEKVPAMYDPKTVRQLQMMTLSAKDQLGNKMAEDKMASEEKWKGKEYTLKQRELDIKEKEAKAKNNGQTAPSGYRWMPDGSLEPIPGGPANKSEALALDKKKIVEGLSAKNASKIAIKNQIDAVMDGWDDLPDDQKVSAGRQLLKVLNSTEGADAIGAEEAKRLGSKLEFAMGNFTNSNPTQFGRDLEGFKAQAMNTSLGIGKAVTSNQKEIDQILGREVGPDEVAQGPKGKNGMFGIPAANASPVSGPKMGDVDGGFQYIGGDPSKQSSWKKLK